VAGWHRAMEMKTASELLKAQEHAGKNNEDLRV
jgi:hypothetical protein